MTTITHIDSRPRVMFNHRIGEIIAKTYGLPVDTYEHGLSVKSGLHYDLRMIDNGEVITYVHCDVCEPVEMKYEGLRLVK